MKNVVNGLGQENLVDYVLKNSTLKIDEFVLAMLGGDGYVHFLLAKNNKIIDLGQFSYDCFIRIEYGVTKAEIIAISRFLNLCIQKITDSTIVVPTLVGNPDFWNDIYK